MEAQETVKGSKKVKIMALRPINIGTIKEEKILIEGQVAEVSEEQAAEFCDRVFTGGRAYVGERDSSDAPGHKIVRAKRV